MGEEDAEDVVQDVFIELWKRQDDVRVGDEIRAFLYRSVYTRALNVLKHRRVVGEYAELMAEIHQKRMEYYQPDNNEVINRIEDAELHRSLVQAIDEPPDKCRAIFRLSYLHDMKNKEIADAMELSIRTVEAHMYKALKFLRERLGNNLRMFLVFFFIGRLSVFLKFVVLSVYL